ncbi:MAG: hypothetical protein ACRC1W_01515 [Shewanella sp.]
MTPTIQHFAPLDNIVVSEGTLDPEDLYAVFYRRITRHLIACAASLDVSPLQRLNASEIEIVRQQLHRSLLDWDVRSIDDDDGGFIEELMEILTGLAPTGSWFGTHPDDGALFGYWPTHLLEINTPGDYV